MTLDVTLALVAHDRYKETLAYFVLEHRAEFKRFKLVATRGTGTVVQRRTGLRVQLLEPGPLGGDQQIAELAAHEVQAVVFFRDPLAQAHGEPDFTQLLDVCDSREIPLATNRATALALLYFLLNSPDRGAIIARPWGLTPPDESGRPAG